jgi:hypothetical protein
VQSTRKLFAVALAGCLGALVLPSGAVRANTTLYAAVRSEHAVIAINTATLVPRWRGSRPRPRDRRALVG